MATNGAFLDPIADTRVGNKRTGNRRIDKARAADTADRPRLAGERERCSGLDDLSEAVAPHRLNGKIDGIAGSEIRPEPDCQWREAPLPFRYRALAHARINQG